MALVSRDEVLWLEGIGRVDLATGRKVTPDTLFRIGSISKSFVGLAVLMLQEQGKLDLNDKLSDLAPEIEFENRWEASAFHSLLVSIANVTVMLYLSYWGIIGLRPWV